MARPPMEIDASLVEELAKIHCSIEEIATILGCSRDTLERRFRDVITKGREDGKATLRRKQWQVAMDDEHKSQGTMLVWLGRNMLDQTDKVIVEAQNQINEADFRDVSSEDLKKLIKKQGT